MDIAVNWIERRIIVLRGETVTSRVREITVFK